MKVFPKPGMFIRDPVKRDFLPEEGRDVADNDFYWLDRIADGDAMTELPPTKSAPAAKNRSNDE